MKENIKLALAVAAVALLLAAGMGVEAWCWLQCHPGAPWWGILVH